METAIWQSYQNNNVLMLGIINTSSQNQIDNFVTENSITFPILFDPGSPGGVQGGDTYNDYYMPNVNLDQSVNILDIILIINFILEIQVPSETQFISSDLNNDSLINILDIIQLVNIILENSN